MDKDSFERLIKALEAGGYNAAPSDLAQGSGSGVILDSWETNNLHCFIPFDSPICFKCGNEIPATDSFSKCTGRSKPKECECGVSKTGGTHSDWCPLK
jgi:hypothetical protein